VVTFNLNAQISGTIRGYHTATDFLRHQSPPNVGIRQAQLRELFERWYPSMAHIVNAYIYAYNDASLIRLL